MVTDHANDACKEGRLALAAWEKEIKESGYQNDTDFHHAVSYHLPGHSKSLDAELETFASIVFNQIEPLVAENNRPENLPRIARYDGIGNKIEEIVHHPSYAQIGNFIYGTRMLERMAKKGGLAEGLMFFFLSSQAGEAGHNCPIACSYGIIRVLQKMPHFPLKDLYIGKLIFPSYDENYTGAQFVTEIQGGSDVGNNAVSASKDDNGHWRVSGEKWFCSNADADLILVTARYNKEVVGTKGLGLFLVPALLDSGERNRYAFRRLKDKLGTRSLATAEIDFQEAFAIPAGKPEEGFKMLMENVLHASRLFNSVCVLGMARRACHIASTYAKHRQAFGQAIIHYPLIQEKLARIKAENTALLASIFATIKRQDEYDLKDKEDPQSKHLLRLLANVNKYLTALWAVQHIHHSLDVLAGNGTIETFSSIPLLFRDSIICENWEGTHSVLQMQILRDILRYEVDSIFLDYIKTQLDQIPKESRYKQMLQENYTETAAKLKGLKEMPPEMQMWHIKECVDRMGILFASLHLLLEAIDQEKKGNRSKMLCLEYFLHVHVQKSMHLSLDIITKIMKDYWHNE